MRTNKTYLDLFNKSRNEFLKLNREQTKKILEIYKDAAMELERKAASAKPGSLTQRWLIDYKKSIDRTIKEINRELINTIKSYMEVSAELAVNPQISMFDKIGSKYDLDVTEQFKKVLSGAPNEIIADLIKGGFYKDNRGLDSRIWNSGKAIQKDIDYIIQQAIAQKKSAYELAKDLQEYVNPGARRDFEWEKVYPNIGNKTIDYNAQRLARTSINHAYFLANVKSSKINPFVEAMHWELSSEHYTRQILRWGSDVCDDYANQNDYGLGRGNYPIDLLPVPHPMCLCTQYPVIPKSLDAIGEELSRWLDGERNPKLDMWFRMYGKEFAA